MGRKLPWAGDASSSFKTSASPAVPKTLPKHGHDTGSKSKIANDSPQQSRPVTPTPHAGNGRTRSRSPSSSPIRAPPQIVPMESGYGADDIYMMVEDEFYSVAQSFTAHLHHAEYKRLKRKAHAQPPQSPPQLLPSTSTEIRMKLQKDALARRQGKALEGLGSAAAKVRDNDEDDVESEVLDPWKGTSLAGLMGGDAGGSLKKTSLVGLERVPSETRAAKGYAPVNKYGSNNGPMRQRVRSAITRYDEAEDRRLTIEEAADDDYDSRNQRIKKERVITSPTTVMESDRRSNTTRAERPNDRIVKGAKINDRQNGERSAIKPTSRLKRSFIDDFDGPMFDPPSPPAIKSEPTRVSDAKREKDNIKDKKARLAEVPIFMI